MSVRLDDFEKNLIEEISTLSGHSESVVRDVLESTFLRQTEFLMAGKDIVIPFIGKLHIKFIEDEWIAGNRSAKVEVFFSPSDLIKRIVGEIHDGDSSFINNLIQRKIRGALQGILNKI